LQVGEGGKIKEDNGGDHLVVVEHTNFY